MFVELVHVKKADINLILLSLKVLVLYIGVQKISRINKVKLVDYLKKKKKIDTSVNCGKCIENRAFIISTVNTDFTFMHGFLYLLV